MAWIRMIREDEPKDDRLRTLYKKYGDPFEGVDNILKIHSLNPESLQHHYDLYKHLMTGQSGLSGMQREMIAVVVSATNGCHY
jgi:alkylhydroperoxidase family enzyme